MWDKSDYYEARGAAFKMGPTTSCVTICQRDTARCLSFPINLLAETHKCTLSKNRASDHPSPFLKGQKEERRSAMRLPVVAHAFSPRPLSNGFPPLCRHCQSESVSRCTRTGRGTESMGLQESVMNESAVSRVAMHGVGDT